MVWEPKMASKRFFLLWFFYINSVIGLMLISYWMGIFQLGFQYDKSYLSFVILGWWVIAEAVIGLNVWSQTREFRALESFKKQLAVDNNLKSVLMMPQFENTLVAKHVDYIVRRYENSKQSVDQTQMAAALERRLMNRNSFGWLASNLMVFLGLLGTVIGIVLTFWPFIDTTTAIDIARIQTHLSSIFAGVGAAFFPSIYSAIFCVFILISDRISNNSTHTLLNDLTAFSETEVLSYVERTNADTQ
jgi:biopolymer transport protein ExbB/TolQ